MNKPRMARVEAELITAALVVRAGALIVGPTGVAVALDPLEDPPPAPPVGTVLLEIGARDPVELLKFPVVRMMEVDLLEGSAEDPDDTLVGRKMDERVLDGVYVVVYELV